MKEPMSDKQFYTLLGAGFVAFVGICWAIFVLTMV
jgi:hypothetical protein